MASSPLPFPFLPTTTSYRAGAIFKFEMCQSAPRHPVHPSHWRTLLHHNLVNMHVTTTSLRLMLCFQIKYLIYLLLLYTTLQWYTTWRNNLLLLDFAILILSGVRRFRSRLCFHLQVKWEEALNLVYPLV